MSLQAERDPIIQNGLQMNKPNEEGKLKSAETSEHSTKSEIYARYVLTGAQAKPDNISSAERKKRGEKRRTHSLGRRKNRILYTQHKLRYDN